MTDKELRRLGRGDLLEMLLNESQRNDENTQQLDARDLELSDAQRRIEEMTQLLAEKDAELEALRAELEDYKTRVLDAEAKAYDKSIALEKAGSIADAAIQINGVLEAAQAAANQYLENVEQMNARHEEVLKEREERHLLMCRRMLADTQAECARRTAKAKEEAEEYRKAVDARIESFQSSYAGMQDLLKFLDNK